MRPLPTVWDEAPWHANLDAEACLRAVPESATITGVFLEGVRDVATSRGVALSAARERYTAFQRYPLREHCELLVEVCRAVFPREHLRQALRRLGRGAPRTLVKSMVGRVMLGSVEGPLATLRAMAKSYMVHMTPSQLEVIDLDESRAVVRMSEIYNFLDSHNVGVFEGVLAYAGARGSVRIASHSATEADLLCDWGQ